MSTQNTSMASYPRAEISPPSGSLFPHKHLLGIWGMDPTSIKHLLDVAEKYVDQNRQAKKTTSTCAGLTQINLFFENSTRTLMSFEIAGKRLGMDTISMSTGTSSIKKGETLLDTAATLNAMHPDVLVMRHADSGAVKLLSEKMDCAVINAGDGRSEHPTQALLDALTIRRRKGQIHGQTIVISGDIAHSRVARSNIYLLNAMGARVRLIAPPTLLPVDVDRLGVEVYHRMDEGLEGADVVMMLRLQQERMNGAFLPSLREYYRFWGLTKEKLSVAKDDVLVMHPGPMNRGVEIASDVADDLDRSAIEEQVEMGVAARMACLDVLTRGLRGDE
ncbi:aspartate carbamoyltransferase catalytic subunit [Kordiimonas sp. SCSIO 12603]|nr:aspartate carbamoyltransferase catalytic subunit [Kordiimonas sp. SCSIO 12603]UTW57036.1 aspartate carbamoyltransferase catalytic subunit [Kordiimonas sp. SCSIO 12603]